MALDRHAIDGDLLELDDQARRQLIDLVARLLPHREHLRALGAEDEQASSTAGQDPDPSKLVTSALLDLFFQYVPSGDFDGYYQAVTAKGKAYQAAGLPYRSLISAAHFVEQVALPVMGRLYDDHAELERALMALDQLSDNAIVLIAAAYFETTLKELRALQQVTDSALSTLDLEELLRSLIKRLIEAIGAECAGILLLDEATGELSLKSAWDARSRSAWLAAGDIVWETGRLAYRRCEVVQQADTEAMRLDGRPAGQAVGLPLKLAGSVIGALCLRRTVGEFDARETQLLALLAERCATAIDHAQLYQRKAHLLLQTAALQRVTAGITTRTALPEILEAVIDGVVDVFGATRVAIFLRDKSSGELVFPAARALADDFLGVLLKELRSIQPLAAATDSDSDRLAQWHVSDAQNDERVGSSKSLFEREGIRTFLVLPFGHEPEVRGALCLFHERIRHYLDEELRVAQTFANQAAIAIAHATLYTEIRERAGELDRMNKELQTLDRMKADFSAMVSHELRTPLTAILGYTDLLLRGGRGDLGERPMGDLKTIRANGQRLLTLINDLIDFSTIEAGRATIARRQVNLGNLLPRVVESFQDQAEARAISLRTEVGCALPPIVGDTAAVEKIVGELLSNAMKFTPRGGVVSVRAAEFTAFPAVAATAADQPSDVTSGSIRWITIAVSDSGVGIAGDQLERIWDHFYQIDSSSARRFGGTGLGLAIVKRLVELQGGSIWAESEGVAGKGSTFSFRLPAANLSAAGCA